jgi:perosamine synthetase
VKRIPISGPSITQHEIALVTDAVTRAWYENANVYHQRFETAFSRYVGRRFAMALPSCTSAIHLALLATGVSDGDEVIIPDATWIASAAPIDYVGATAVFADVDPDSWCLSAAAVESVITPRTKAIIPVDLYGGMPAMADLEAIASRSGLLLIEDAAEAVGATYRGRPAGSFGVASVFSFHGSKTLTTGEGGMLVTDDEALFERASVLRDHGRVPGDVSFYNREVAHKYKMSSMQAALGLAQLERVDELVAMKREIFRWYHERLSATPGLTLNHDTPDVRPAYWMVTVIPDARFGVGKRELIAHLGERGIDARPFFYPLSSLPAYAARPQAIAAARRNSVAYRLSDTGVNLPSGLNMTEDLVDIVCTALREALA